jgi:hypothetical protein
MKKINFTKWKNVRSFAKEIKKISQSISPEKQNMEYSFENESLTQKKKSEKLNFSKVIEYFLPKDYPDSVNINYVPYCKWSSLQYICSSVCGGLKLKIHN